MKSTRKVLSRGLSRRRFLQTTTLAAGAVTFGVPTLLRAQNLNSKLNIASVGCMGKGESDVNHCSGENIVALCDVDKSHLADAAKDVPDARQYTDWRELLAKEIDHIDSVNIAVPDHMHAIIALAFIRAGKNVYCQKPLAHDIHEIRTLMKMAQTKNLPTQMGIQIHSWREYKVAVKVIQSGAIGKVKEVHSWCPKSWGDLEPKPNRTDPVPANFDWNLWLGVCAELAGVFLGQDGRPVATPMDSRMIVTPGPALERIPLVLSVAYGVSKSPAVCAAIRGDMVHGLVTHASLARALLNQADGRDVGS